MWEGGGGSLPIKNTKASVITFLQQSITFLQSVNSFSIITNDIQTKCYAIV
jgi:hypothetical protein